MVNTKKKIIIIEFFLCPVIENIKKMLEQDYEIYFIDRFGVHNSKYNKFLNRTKSTIIEKIIYILKFPYSLLWTFLHRKKIKVVLGFSEPNWFIFPFFKLVGSNVNKVYFPYDIVHFEPKKNKLYTRLELKMEKKNFIICNKIVHKGLDEELKLLPFYKEIKDKPSYLFRNFLNINLIQKYNPAVKLSTGDNEIHAVYCGGWYYKDTDVSSNFFKLYEIFYKNKIHVHVYSKLNNKRQYELMKKYENKFPYFHYEGSIKHNKLIKELTKYDYGLNVYGFLYKKKSNKFIKTAFSNKTFDYLSAKLPVIVNKEAEAISQFVDKWKVGYVINIKSSKLLKEINKIKRDFKNKNHYSNLIKNIEKLIEKYKHKDEEFLNFIRGNEVC